MKTKIIITISLIIAITVIARQIPQFLGWDKLVSTDVVVLRYGKPAPPTSGFVPVLNGAKCNSPINVLFVLKGTNYLTQLQTSHELQEGENYLLFGYYDGGSYQAMEDYSIIPLGKTFSTNVIAGKPYDEQISILFKLRIDELNRQIQSAQQEKERLEQGLRR